MKTSDLNQMNKLELKTRLSENLDALQNLRFQKGISPARLVRLRRLGKLDD